MKKLNQVLIALLLMLYGIPINAQEVVTSSGTDFSFVYLQNRIRSDGSRMNFGHQPIELRIFVTNDASTATDVQLAFTGNDESTDKVTFENASYIGPLESPIVSIAAGQTQVFDVFVEKQIPKVDPCGNSTTTIPDMRLPQMMDNGIVQNKTFTVTSLTFDNGERNTISVYAESSQTRSRDAAIVLPVSALGTDYIAMTGNIVTNPNNTPVNRTVPKNTGNQNDTYECGPLPNDEWPDEFNNGGPAEIAILAMEDDVEIEVIFNQASNPLGSVIQPDLSIPANQPAYNDFGDRITFTLSKNESMQLQSDDVDLSGTRIRALNKKKIAVFSGNMATHMVENSANGYYDHVYEQMLPSTSYGCNYAMVSSRNIRSSQAIANGGNFDFFKIAALEDNTTVEIWDQGMTGAGHSKTLAAGEVLHITRSEIQTATVGSHPSRVGHDLFVSADRKITVAQLTASEQETSASSNTRSFQDPSMVMLSAMDQRLKSTNLPILPAFSNSLSWNGSIATDKNDYVMVIRSTNDPNAIRWTYNGGSPTWLNSSCYTSIPGSSFEYAIVNCRLDNPPTDCETCDPSSPMSLSTQGLNPAYATFKYDSPSNSSNLGFIAYSYGFDRQEAYFSSAGISFTRVGVTSFDEVCMDFEGNIGDPLEIEAEGAEVSGSTDPYTWSIVSGPNNFSSSYTITDVFEDEHVAKPVLEENFEFPETGEYIFEVNVGRDVLGACGSIAQQCTVKVSYCCPAATAPEYSPKYGLVSEGNNIWNDKVYVADQVRVLEGTVLDVTNVDVVFAECGEIIIEEGAGIRANNSVFRSCNPEIPWKGITFEGPSDFISQINECEFKYAMRAVEFKDGASCQVANNIFINNYEGIRVEYTQFDKFKYPISGNKFIIDKRLSTTDPAQIFLTSCDLTIDQNTHYGIVGINVDFAEPISQNEFVGSTFLTNGSDLKKFKGILLTSCAANINQNRFSNMYKSISAQNLSGTLRIEGNQMDISSNKESVAPQIDLHTSTQPTYVENNILNCWNMDLNNSSNAGIYAKECQSLTVRSNELTGYTVGILFEKCDNSYILSNHLKDAIKYGIYVHGTKPSIGNGFVNNETIQVGCNEVNMDFGLNNKPAVGIGIFNLGNSSKIFSNCVFDCMISMYCLQEEASAVIEIPEIVNNYFYNFYWAGLFTNHYYSSDANNVKGNTFFSNSNNGNTATQSAWDVRVEGFTSPYLFLASNSFGLNVKYGPTLSGPAHYSTASCGHQIFWNGTVTQYSSETHYINSAPGYVLDPNLNCDGSHSQVFGVYNNNGGITINSLSSLDRTWGMPNSSDDYLGVLKTLSYHEQVDALWEAFEIGQKDENLSDFDKVRLEVELYILLSKAEKAKDVLFAFIPQSIDQADWKTIFGIQLQIELHGLDLQETNEENINQLVAISSKNSLWSDMATSLLNTITGGYEYVYTLKDVEKPQGPSGNDLNTLNSLTVYPNPAKQQINLVLDGHHPNSQVEIFNSFGALISTVSTTTSSGTLKLDIEELAKGMYFIKVVSSDGESFASFVKE